MCALVNPEYRQCHGQTGHPPPQQVPTLIQYLIPASRGGQGKLILKKQALLCGEVTEYPGGGERSNRVDTRKPKQGSTSVQVLKCHSAHSIWLIEFLMYRNNCSLLFDVCCCHLEYWQCHGQTRHPPPQRVRMHQTSLSISKYVVMWGKLFHFIRN